MSKRAEHVEDTRRRIVEATVLLHTTIGPAATTIAGIADAANVTRLTVYRHFPELEPLFTACRALWRDTHPAPDPARWTAVADLGKRARIALGELYAFYRANVDDLGTIYRDAATMPELSRREMAQADHALGDAVAGNAEGPAALRRLQTVARHLVLFETWRALTIDGAFDDDEAAELGRALLLLVVDRSWRPPTAGQSEE